MPRCEIRLVEDYVSTFLDKLDPKAHKAIHDRLLFLMEYGVGVLSKVRDLVPVKGYQKVGMYEFKVHHVLEYRFLGRLDGNTITFVHVFIKKTQKIPPKELKLAEKRIKELTKN